MKQQQLFFSKFDIGDIHTLEQVICTIDKQSKSSLSVENVCRNIILKHNILASPDIICKAKQIEEIKATIKENHMQMKQSKVDPWMVHNNILSYIKIKLQSLGWTKLCGLLLKGDLFAKDATNLRACEMEIHIQQDETLAISVSNPHTVRYKPVNVNIMQRNPFPPPPCYVLPTLSGGFISRIQAFPPLGGPFRNVDDFKSYWFKAHGLILPEKIENYVQVRLNDLELTYPSCCLWDSKLMEVRSHSTDTSMIICDLLDDLKSIEIFSRPLLILQETATPIAPKVTWVKSSVMMKHNQINEIENLPNVEPLIITKPNKPNVIKEPETTNLIPEPQEKTNSNLEPENKATYIPKLGLPPKSNTENDSLAKDLTRKRTLGARRSKQTEIQTSPKKTTSSKKEETKSKLNESANKETESKAKETISKAAEPNKTADSMPDMLAFDNEFFETNYEKERKEDTPPAVRDTKDAPQVGKKQKRDDNEGHKPKRAKVEIDVAKLDFSAHHLNSRTVQELQAFCRKEKLKIKGTKTELIGRVNDFIEKNKK